jgi:L-ascorbate metabolism protein UlaG (beta-lactamase superfamily)
MKLTYFGHSCFQVEISGKTLLFDPFISPNEKAKHIDIYSLKPDYILVSHAHEDHIADLIPIAKQSGAKVISVWEIFAWLGKQGLQNLHPMNSGGSFSFDFGTVQTVNAIHSSSFPDGSYGGNPVGFIVTSADKKHCFYYAGDTALTTDMQLIPLRHQLDFAVLPIGSNFTMDSHDAAMAAEWVKAPKVIGVHYDTFGYIVIDHEAAKQTFSRKQVELLLPEIGETIEV